MRLTNEKVRHPRNDIAKHVGKQLFKLRQVKQVPMRTVAEGSGVSIAFICEIENGQSSPTIETLWRISQYFGVEIGFFVNGYRDTR